MHDVQVNKLDATDALVQKILSNDDASSTVHALLGDKDVKVAIISEMRDFDVPATGLVYKLLVLAFGGCERFLAGSLKSRLKAYIDNTPGLAGILKKILDLQHGAKAQAELKNSLLASLKDGKPIEPDITADEASTLEMIVALHTAKQPEDLNDHITRLGDEVVKGFRDDLADQFNQQVAPDLGWHDEVVSPDKLTALQHLKYTSEIDKFLGRKNEIDLLHRFAGDPSFGGRVFNFRWMLLTGDAGVGKTRLAHEFTRNRLDDLWYKGKLDFASLKAFDKPAKWRPVRPTFIVIDHVQFVPKEVHALLRAFSSQAVNYEFPVRLLLLERDTNASWAEKLLPESGDKPVIDLHNFGGQSVLGEEIDRLSDDAIVELMKQRILNAQLDAPERERLLALARSVDHPEPLVNVDGQIEPAQTPRPLFAIATAEAIIDAIKTGQELPEYFGLSEVLAGNVQRDRDTIWRNTVPIEAERRRYEMGLAVATLAQGISLRDLNEDHFGGGTSWLPPIPPDHDSVSLAAFGYRDERWPPMEPDILGEFFVSEQLLNADLLEEYRIALIEGALLLGKRQAAITLFRMARDFPRRLKQLRLENIARTTLHEGILLSLANLAVALTEHGSDFSVAMRILDAVLDREDWSNSRELGISVAVAAVNISASAGVAGDWNCVADMLSRLDVVRNAFPQDQEVALADATAAVNICDSAGATGDWGRVAEMAARLVAVRNAFPLDQNIALQEAKAAFSISNSAGEAGARDRITEIEAKLDTLRKDFPLDQEIALEVAKVAVNIAFFAGAAGDRDSITEIMARLDTLRKAFPLDQEIALADAIAAFNIANSAGEAGDRDRITEIDARLVALRKAFPQNQEIAREVAKAAVSIVISAGEAGDRDSITETIARLDTLRKAFPLDQEIALADAMAAFNISISARKARDWDRITEIGARLDAVRKAFPLELAIALADGMAAPNISSAAGEAGDRDSITRVMARLDAARKAFPQNPELALADAMAAYNISNSAGEAGDWDRITEVLVRLDALGKAFPHDRDITRVVANAVTNISKFVIAADECDRITEIAARLVALGNTFLQDLESAPEAAKVAANISITPDGTFTHQSGKVGRNQPCPCGSGKKFKQCCLRHSLPH